MRRLVIHIGAHKTGTTTIQRVLAASPRSLAWAGLVYPEICWHLYGHHRLAFAARGRGLKGQSTALSLEDELAEVERAVTAAEGTVILSSEELFSAPAEGVRRIGRLREIAEVKVVAFLRRQDLLIESMYNQRVKAPRNRFTPTADEFASGETLPAELDFEANLSNWAEAFGDEAIELRLHGAQDSVEAFLDAVGYPTINRPAAKGWSNRKVEPELAEMVRLAKVGGAAPEDILSIIRLALPRRDRPPRRLLSRDRAVSLMRRFEAGNAALFERFVGTSSPYTADAAAADHPGPHGLDEARLAQVVAALAGRVSGGDGGTTAPEAAASSSG